MFPHAGSRNHGCEAIIRTTVNFLGNNKENISVYTEHIDSDNKVNLNELVKLIPSSSEDKIDLKSLKGISLRVKAKILKKDLDNLLIYEKHKLYKRYKLALSIGGDNYCYKGMIYVLNEQCKAIDHFKIPRILWGCSFDEQLIDKKVVEELKGYKAIFVRESLSLNILKNIGIEENVYLYPDPAFTLSVQSMGFKNKDFTQKGVIGINISPLMGRYTQKELLDDNFNKLIKYILENTDKNIALIPHVTQEGNSDLEYMMDFYERFKCDRVELIDGHYNCMQLKSLISQCEMFIGCRTHATIAAYSTCVPTLVVGYSNKSIGIARDIFGTEEGYIISVNDIKRDEELLERYKIFSRNLSEEKILLKKVMPAYCNRAKEGGIKLKTIINNCCNS